MRKVFLFMVVSVDGFFEGPNQDITWHMVDDEFNQFAIEQMKQIDTLLLGRKTYQLFESFWPNAGTMPDMTPDDLKIAQMLDKVPKYAFSQQGISTLWQNTTVITDDAANAVKKLKGLPGKDIAIFGSNNLCVSLMQDNLIDEFRIMVCPVALGQGTPLFGGIKNKVALNLANTKTFKNGNILITYHPV